MTRARLRMFTWAGQRITFHWAQAEFSFVRGRGNDVTRKDVTRRIGLTDLEPRGLRVLRSLGSRAGTERDLGVR